MIVCPLNTVAHVKYHNSLLHVGLWNVAKTRFLTSLTVYYEIMQNMYVMMPAGMCVVLSPESWLKVSLQHCDSLELSHCLTVKGSEYYFAALKMRRDKSKYESLFVRIRSNLISAVYFKLRKQDTITTSFLQPVYISAGCCPVQTLLWGLWASKASAVIH